MNKRTLEKQLIAFGITSREAKVYLALLEKKHLTAQEIHKLTHLPRAKIYDTAHKLTLRGMCIEKQIKGRKIYQAVEPRKVFNSMINSHESDLQEKKKQAKDMLSVIQPLYNTQRPEINISDYFEIVSGLQSIHERFVALLNKTKREVVGFAKAPYAHQYKPHILHEQDNTEFQRLKRGVAARVLYEEPCPEERKWIYDHIEKCVQAGEQARVVKYLPVKMYIFDERYILVTFSNSSSPASPLTMVVTEHPALAQAGRMFFNYMWEQAEDYQILKP